MKAALFLRDAAFNNNKSSDSSNASSPPLAQPISPAQQIANTHKGAIKAQAFLEQQEEHARKTQPKPMSLLQKWWTWYSGVMVFSMLEFWEIILLHAIFILSLYVIIWGCRTYLPGHARFIAGRTLYYIKG